MNFDLLISASTGVIASIVIKIIDTYRSKQKSDDEHSKTNADAAKSNVESANVINLMMRGMLDQERAYFDKELVRASEDCAEKIDRLKEEYDEKISLLQSDNESLNILVGNISRDNLALNVKVVSLTQAKDENELKFTELRRRLSKYENITTAELEAIAKQKQIK